MFAFLRPFLFETPGGAAAGAAPPAAAPPVGGAAPEQQQAGLYDQFLNDVPEDLRPYVEEQFKEWDRGVTPKLQEAAQIREKLGAFADIEGIDQVEPEAVQGLVQLHNMILESEQNPEPFVEWLKQANEAMGLTVGADGLDEETWASMGEANGWFEGDGDEGGGEAPDIESHPLVQQLMERLEAAEGKLTEQERSQTTEQERQQLESRMTELMPTFAGFEQMDPEAKQELGAAIVEMAHAYAQDEDPIGKAVERVKFLRGEAVGAAAERDLQQPAGALQGGQASTSPPAFKGFGDPALKEAVRARVSGG